MTVEEFGEKIKARIAKDEAEEVKFDGLGPHMRQAMLVDATIRMAVLLTSGSHEEIEDCAAHVAVRAMRILEAVKQ